MEWTKLSTNEIKMLYKVNGQQETTGVFFPYIFDQIEGRKNKTHQNYAKTEFQIDQYIQA